ncbi:regulator-Ty1 transposition [Fusarium mexicanum]|uniref:Regulator-Ty1 transposition n=1 Tax=Fusarium mexicanum TaxID=751941 RepID=A0A8H5MN50_9HYPO|nr:regulator-Ty1 transposition [Fusarium mexicanum]
MGTKCEDPINIRINALHIVDDSPVDPRSELQDAIRDFNQAVASAKLRGQRLVALLNDPDVVYKASEEELFKVRTNVNRITKSAQSVTGAIDRSLVEIITSRITSRGRHRTELDQEWKAGIRNEWNDFWIRTLNNWLNSATVFTSNHSFIPNGAPASKVDLFSLSDDRVSDMLHHHLEEKNCFGGRGPLSNGDLSDNLVSWTSSFMNAIQYAIWRSHVGHTSTSNVHICVVDTRKFPRGQFARDMWLLDTYAHPNSNWLRLENPEYDNGEYLSQGVIHHGGRSSVFSLQDLMSFNLYKLYPEFAVPTARGSWTNRVLELRSDWTGECNSSFDEFFLAHQIATGSMKKFDAWDVILLLMTFRQRQTPWMCNLGDFSKTKFPEPIEVCRYRALLKIAEKEFDQKLGENLSEEAKKDAHLQNMDFVGDMFVSD